MTEKRTKADPNEALQAILLAATKAARTAEASFTKPIPEEAGAATLVLVGMGVGALALCGAGLCMMAYGLIARGAATE